MGPSQKNFLSALRRTSVWSKTKGEARAPRRSLYLTLKKLSGRTIMPLPLGLPHLGNIVANMFANPYPIVETVYLLKGPHVPNKSRLLEVSLLVSFARKSVKECDMVMLAAGELCGHQCGRPNTHISHFEQTRDCSQSK